jgi:hypothetical protein
VLYACGCLDRAGTWGRAGCKMQEWCAEFCKVYVGDEKGREGKVYRTKAMIGRLRLGSGYRYLLSVQSSCVMFLSLSSVCTEEGFR